MIEPCIFWILSPISSFFRRIHSVTAIIGPSNPNLTGTCQKIPTLSCIIKKKCYCGSKQQRVYIIIISTSSGKLGSSRSTHTSLKSPIALLQFNMIVQVCCNKYEEDCWLWQYSLKKNFVLADFLAPNPQLSQSKKVDQIRQIFIVSWQAKA